MTDPIAYTYDADTHCPDCAEAAHGYGPVTGEPNARWEIGYRLVGSIIGTPNFITRASLDKDGNEIGAVAPWDEWYDTSIDFQTLACATCHKVIATFPTEPDCDHKHQIHTCRECQRSLCACENTYGHDCEL